VPGPRSLYFSRSIATVRTSSTVSVMRIDPSALPASPDDVLLHQLEHART
jgi:hypothetical protein